MFSENNFKEKIGELSIPICVLQGSQDKLVTPEGSEVQLLLSLF